MLRKFLRTSVLTLGAGLCVLATLQNESHAIILDCFFDAAPTVTTGVYVKYRDPNNQEQIQWGPTNETSVGAKTKTSIDEPDIESLKDHCIIHETSS